MSETFLLRPGDFRSNVVGELARYVFQGYEPSIRRLQVECYRRANRMHRSSVQCSIRDRVWVLSFCTKFSTRQHAEIREFGPFLAFHCAIADISSDLSITAVLCCVLICLA